MFPLRERSAIAGAFLAVSFGLSMLLGACGGGERGGRVVVAFDPGPRQEERLVRPALTRAARQLSRKFHLPADLHVHVVREEALPERPGRTQTGAASRDPGPHYDRSARTVFIPWPSVAMIRDDLRRLQARGRLSQPPHDALAGAMTFILYHEIAHGLIDLLDLPIVGNEERVADGLAGILAVGSGPDGERIALGGAALLDARGDRESRGELGGYAGRHGFSRQRAFDVLCLIHGSGTRRERLRVGGRPLPAERARTCRFEYQGRLRAWERHLGPWLTRPDALRRR